MDYFYTVPHILKINIGFTCDAVKNNGKNIAKEGRGYRNNPKLKEFK